jgi:hypothetical protein
VTEIRSGHRGEGDSYGPCACPGCRYEPTPVPLVDGLCQMCVEDGCKRPAVGKVTSELAERRRQWRASLRSTDGIRPHDDSVDLAEKERTERMMDRFQGRK